MASVKVLSTTLLANHNTVQVTDSAISNNSIFEIYVSDPDLVCNNIVVGGTTANITFDSKPTSNTSIKVLVNNIDGNFTVNASDVVSGTTNQDAINTSVSTSLSGKVDTTTLNERVPSETVLGGVLYHGTTGNEWKVLSGSIVNYDSNKSINSAIGNLENLSTSIKSDLVSAINTINNIYDNNERVVGEWYGKPLYRKVLSLTFSTYLPQRVWTTTNINVGQIEIKNAFFVRNDDAKGTFTGVWTRVNNSVLEIFNWSNYDIGVTVMNGSNCIIEYTKVGD